MSVTLYHPSIPGLGYTVPDSAVDAWTAAGWLNNAPPDDYQDHAPVQAVETAPGAYELRATMDDGGTVALGPYASRSTVMHGSRTIVLGDSIDAQISGWFYYLAILSGKINIVRNAGIGGNTTTQMLARIQADVIAHKPEIVILGSATNDHSQGITESTTRDNIGKMVDAILAAGAIPVFRTTAPADTQASVAPFNTVASRRQAIFRHNSWLKAFAAARGFYVLDVYAGAADPLTGGFKPGYSTDGIHPVEIGSRAMADYVLAAGLPAIFRGGFMFARAAADDSNCLKNGVFVGDSNSDGIADNWLIAVGAANTTKSLIPGTGDVVGNWQRIATDGTNASAIVQDITPTATDSTGAFVYQPGDVLEFCGRIRASGGAPVLVRVTPYDSVPNDTVTPVYNLTQPIANGVFSGRVKLGTGTTKLRMQIQTGTIGAASPAGWVEIAEVALRNLTRPATV